MYINRNFNLIRLLRYSWHVILTYMFYAACCVALYEHLDCKWLQIPWLPISIIGTAVAFYVGFKNNSAYDRTWEARKIWGAIVNSSRSWGIMVKDFITPKYSDKEVSKEDLHQIHQELMYRHIVWLYGLRRQLWQPKSWEHNRPFNARYRKFLAGHFAKESMEDELAPFLDEEELKWAMARKNTATHLISKQSERLKELHFSGLFDDFRHVEMKNMLVDFYTQQGKCERIKNFPFPRQYASSSFIFISIFIILLPFGLMSEFNKIGSHAVWMTVPFTALVGWVYWLMESVGDYAENPFEGLAFDTPMTALCRTIEIDLREMLGETDLPPAIQPKESALL